MYTLSKRTLIIFFPLVCCAIDISWAEHTSKKMSKSWPNVPAVSDCPTVPSLNAINIPKGSSEREQQNHNIRTRSSTHKDLSYDYSSVVGVLHMSPPHEYSCQEMGNTVLGYYMGDRLRNMTNATYLYHTPTTKGTVKPYYNHYTIHYFNHNTEEIVFIDKITEDMFVECVGDSANVCPPRTRALCTSEGLILCLGSSFLAKPCANLIGVNCVRSPIPCVLEPEPKCNHSKTAQETEIEIPCLYYTKMLVGVVYNKHDFSFSLAKREEESSSEMKTKMAIAELQKTYCVTMIAKPAKLIRSKVLAETDNIFGKLAGIVFQF